MFIIDTDINKIVSEIERKHRVIFDQEIHNGNGTFLYRGHIAPDEIDHSVKQVVVKILKSNDLIIQDNFDQEAYLYTLLNHKNIVRTHFTGKISIGSESHRFIVMEYIDGFNLKKIIERSSVNDVSIKDSIAIKIIIEVLQGLSYIHKVCDNKGKVLNIVHSDISADNIMITIEGEVKILDLGVAKTALSDSSRIAGKLSYMSPEQRRGEIIDRRTDLYATTIVLGELLLTREVNFKTFNRIRSKDGIDPDFGEIIDKGLAIKADRRFQTADEMIQALENCMMKKNIVPRFSDIKDMVAQVSDHLLIQPTMYYEPNDINEDIKLKNKNDKIVFAGTKKNPFLNKLSFAGLILSVSIIIFIGTLKFINEKNSVSDLTVKESPIQKNAEGIKSTSEQLAGVSQDQIQDITKKSADDSAMWKPTVEIISDGANLVITNGNRKWTGRGKINISDLNLPLSEDQSLFHISASKSGFKNKSLSITVKKENPIFHTDIDLEKSEYGKLQVRVDPPAVQVSIRDVISNREGPFSIDIPEGDHLLVAKLFDETKRTWDVQKTKIQIKPNSNYKCIVQFEDPRSISCQ